MKWSEAAEVESPRWGVGMVVPDRNAATHFAFAAFHFVFRTSHDAFPFQSWSSSLPNISTSRSQMKCRSPTLFILSLLISASSTRLRGISELESVFFFPPQHEFSLTANSRWCPRERQREAQMKMRHAESIFFLPLWKHKGSISLKKKQKNKNSFFFQDSNSLPLSAPSVSGSLTGAQHSLCCECVRDKASVCVCVCLCVDYDRFHYLRRGPPGSARQHLSGGASRQEGRAVETKQLLNQL